MKETSRGTFRSLRIHNYRLYFMGQLVSFAGTWMQDLAQNILITYRLHQGGTVLGLFTAARFVPMLLLGAWVGAFIDRVDKRKVLMWTNAAMATTSGILAVLTLTHVVRLWMVFVIALFSGTANAFDNPTRQSFGTELVGPDDLPNAIALNSTMFNSARLIGPWLATQLLPSIGPGGCFAVNAASFLAIILSLVLMRKGEMRTRAPVRRAKGQIRAGFAHVRESKVLTGTMIIVTIIGTLALNFTVVMPLMAKEVFKVGEGGVAGFFTASAIGTLVGSILAARRKRVTARLVVVAAGLYGLAMGATAMAPTVRTEQLALVVMGLCSMTFMLSANATLQLHSRVEMRGRVMALYSVAFLGSTPIGGPIVGWVCQRFGARWGFGIGAIACLVSAALGVLLLWGPIEVPDVQPALKSATTA